MIEALSKFRPGQVVRCEREAPSRGSWAKYAGREAKVVTVSRQNREIGVTFSMLRHSVDAWFRPSELVILATGEAL
jgi:hypothetical protein